MPQDAEILVYIGSDLQLYAYETAPAPLPSHELVLNYDVACKLTFQIKGGVNETFNTTNVADWLSWHGGNEPPSWQVDGAQSNQVSFTVTNGNQGSTLSSYPFDLLLASGNPVSFYKSDGTRVDPTVVEKPPG